MTSTSEIVKDNIMACGVGLISSKLVNIGEPNNGCECMGNQMVTGEIKRVLSKIK